jgi:glucokinase
MKKCSFVADIGASKVRAAVTFDKVHLESIRIIGTPSKFNEAMKLIGEVVSEITKGCQVEAAVVGVAGPMDRGRARLLKSNLEDWVGKPLREKLEGILGANLVLENDCALVGLGEATKGAGKGEHIVSYITVSSGVNGVRIVDEKIDNNVYGFEIGKQVVAKNKTLENLISGLALEKKYGEKPEYLHDRKIWKEEEENLAIGVANTILYWSPNVVVLGGALMDKISIDQVTRYVGGILNFYPELPDIRRAILGDFGGLWGGLKMLLSIEY